MVTFQFYDNFGLRLRFQWLSSQCHQLKFAQPPSPTPTSSIPSPFDVITLFLKVLLPFFLIKPALLWGQWMALSAQRHHKMVNKHLPEMAIEQRCDCADTHGPARCRLLNWAGNVFFFTSESPSVKGSSKKGAHSEHWSHISSSSFRLLSWLSNL